MGHGASAGRGFEVVPRNPDNPYESPEQTKRGLEMRDTLNQGHVPDDYRDPAAAQFPVNALGTAENDGYGVGYNKGPLDVGYEPPKATRPRWANPLFKGRR